MCSMSQEMRQTNINEFLHFAQKQTTLYTYAGYLYRQNETTERYYVTSKYLGGDSRKIDRVKR